ncbi:MAG: MATE family efflux transporter, partial [Lachnospiraceae bacterium]|nr:MATE family efflux transporter [Lachnospiraceae bacterium]
MNLIKKLFLHDKTFYERVLVLALPIALQSLITIGVNMLDTIMVGRLGETQLSATSLANQFISIYHIFCMGLGMGASVLVSRYWGMREKEHEKAMEALRKTICIMVRLTVSLALVFAVLTALIPGAIMGMYTEEAGIISYGITYLEY